MTEGNLDCKEFRFVVHEPELVLNALKEISEGCQICHGPYKQCFAVYDFYNNLMYKHKCSSGHIYKWSPQKILPDNSSEFKRRACSNWLNMGESIETLTTWSEETNIQIVSRKIGNKYQSQVTDISNYKVKEQSEELMSDIAKDSEGAIFSFDAQHLNPQRAGRRANHCSTNFMDKKNGKNKAFLQTHSSLDDLKDNNVLDEDGKVIKCNEKKSRNEGLEIIAQRFPKISVMTSDACAGGYQST